MDISTSTAWRRVAEAAARAQTGERLTYRGNDEARMTGKGTTEYDRPTYRSGIPNVNGAATVISASSKFGVCG
jgi:hypothetical protein